MVSECSSGTQNDEGGFTVTGVSILKCSATCVACTKHITNSVNILRELGFLRNQADPRAYTKAVSKGSIMLSVYSSIMLSVCYQVICLFFLGNMDLTT